jgi:hypothetical protein
MCFETKIRATAEQLESAMGAKLPQGTLALTLGNYNAAVAMGWLCKAFRFEKRFVRRLMTAIALLIAAATAVVMLGRVLGVSSLRDLGLRLDASASVGEEVVAKQPNTFAGEHQATSLEFSAASDHLAGERGVREVAVAVVSETEHLANGSDGTLIKVEIERELEDTRQQLARERSAREEAQRGAKEARERLVIAERAGETLHEQLAAEHNARLTAEVAAEETRQQLAKDHGDKEAAERVLKKPHHGRAKHAEARTSMDARSQLLLESPI